MSSKFRLSLLLLGVCAAVGLGACILVPDGDGHGGGDHEDREHHDHDREHGDDHRHDFGLEQKERFGQGDVRNERLFAELLDVAIYVPYPARSAVRPIWA